MITNGLVEYIKKELIAGKSISSIEKGLLTVGWNKKEIRTIFNQMGLGKKYKKTRSANVSPINIGRGLDVLLIILILISSFMGFNTIRKNFDLQNSPVLSSMKNVAGLFSKKEIPTSSTVLQANVVSVSDEIKDDLSLRISGIKNQDAVEEIKGIFDKKTSLVNSGANFIEADLEHMMLYLYENGEKIEEFEILTKGKSGSWWETPTGEYQALSKLENHLSSIGGVFMPYSIQFYGNYFIHGWPYYQNGTPVESTYSGGCIRLATEDAKKVFEFSKLDTPILVLEEKSNGHLGKLIKTKNQTVLPDVSAKSFLISDLSTKNTLAAKRSDEKMPVASITKLMTAIVAHEIFYLGREFVSRESDATTSSQIFNPQIGKRYVGMDLLYPLLMQSSNETASMFAKYSNENHFIQNMNKKASSLKMLDTKFADASGLSAENISTAKDLEKLIKYIYDKRPFIFDITKGVSFKNVGFIKIGDTIDIKNLKNFNEFYSEENLIGVKNGQTTAARETLVTVWNLKTKTGDVPVSIIVLGSENREKDTELLLDWVLKNFETL